MKLKIISGGQCGADQGALRAAKAAGVETGGWAPKGWLTEDGPAPWLAEYGLKESRLREYPHRTQMNVQEATAILWFGNPHSPGGRLTHRLADETPSVVGTFTVIDQSTPADVVDWLVGFIFPGEDAVTLLVAGNRESGSPGIGERVEKFVGEVLALLVKEEL